MEAHTRPAARTGAGAQRVSGTRRTLLLGGAALAGNAALLGRLWQLQVVEADVYRVQAANNRTRTTLIRPLRGLIYDRNREPLVANAPVFSAWLTPAELPPEREGPVLANLAVLTGERIEDLGFKLSQARLAPDTPARLARAVPRESALTIEERRHDLPGISVRTSTRREYAHGDIFGHILGFTGPIPAEEVEAYREQGVRFDEDIGLAGVERSLQSHLRGQDGEQRTETDAFGRVLHEVSFKSPQVGRHAVLTIAVNEQQAIREILARHLALRDRGAGAVVVLRPDSGDIVAMVSLPDYDSNIFTRGASTESFALLVSDPRRPLINHAVSGLYPPGSTYKVIAASGALEAGVVLPQSKIHCDGSLVLPSGWAFDDWLPQGHGLVDLQRAIAESCNIYFYNVSGGNPYTKLQGLGNRRLAEFEREFGFGARTGIDLPGEASGLVPTSEWKNKNLQQPWVTGDTYHAAIGQGLVQVTPLQITCMYAAIGNGGRVMRPRLIDRMLDQHGNVAERIPPHVRSVLPISPENLGLLQAGLYRAVNEPSGTGLRARSSHTIVAGKTGTAEYSGQRDAQDRLPSHAWFAGYAPAAQPEYAFAVLVRDGGEGSFAAAPIARDVVDYLMTGNMPPLPQERPDFIPPDRRL